jgi:8-hydroxy-5-deazaflavin:NADPH oxidoreductase
MIGTRDVSKAEVVAFISENAGIQAGSFEDCAKYGDLLVLATAGGVIVEAVKLAGPANFAGKVVLDATNPIGGAPVDGVLPLFTSSNKSLMEMIAEVIPDANLVKCFSSTGSYTFYKPDFKGQRGSMFICGNSEEAKAVAKDICDKFGWDVEDVGTIRAAYALEALVSLWCQPGFAKNDWFHAFKVIR